MPASSPPLLFARRAAIFLLALAALHFALAPLLPLPNERRHFALPLAWGLDWLLFVRPRLAPGWKKYLPALFVLALALGAMNWALVLEGAKRGGGTSGFEEWVWKNAISLSLAAHWSLLARLLASTLRALSISIRLRLVLTATLATLLLIPYGFTVLNVHRVKSQSGREPSAVGLKFERVRFASGPLQLQGWWIPAARKTTRAVIVCHGVSANAGAFLGVAPFLHRAGFNVLYFDFRGHGQSPGHTISFGWHESGDVRAAAKYLRARGQDRIALYGFSMGGAAVNLAFHSRWSRDKSFDSSVRAVIVDSTFARFAPLVEVQLGAVPAWARPSLMWILGACSEYEIGARPSDIAPREAIGRVAPRPLLIIHGTQDQLVPLPQGRELFRAARQPKTLRVVPNAAHCYCRLVDPPAYEKAVAAWLARALR